MLESSLEERFEVSEDQHSSFISYLHEQTLQVDVWDANKQQHYGCGRVNLVKLLR